MTASKLPALFRERAALQGELGALRSVMDTDGHGVLRDEVTVITNSAAVQRIATRIAELTAEIDTLL